MINQQLPEDLYGSCEKGAIVMSQCAGQSEDFEMGKCRVIQQKDCTEVSLSPGAAGYTGLNSLIGLAPSNGATIAIPTAPTALPSRPVVLARTPRILSQDPDFKLSDSSDIELQRVGQFPDAFNTGGQCSTYGS